MNRRAFLSLAVMCVAIQAFCVWRAERDHKPPTFKTGFEAINPVSVSVRRTAWCSDDGKTWWAARETTCWEADKPK